MSGPEQQNYKNHKKISPIYHYVLAMIALIVLIASIAYIVMERFSYASILFLGISICLTILVMIVRQYALKLQDRIIRQEESFRHFRLTGEPLDSRLTLQQIIALRFAEDDAFPSLCVKAVETEMQPDAIKKSIPLWRADHHRV